MVVGLTAAARLAGKPRSTLVRHVRAGRLSTVADSSGKLRFDTAELSRCYNLQPERTVAPATDDTAVLRAELDHVKAELARERDRADRTLALLERLQLPEPTVAPATSSYRPLQPNGTDPVLQVLHRIRGRLSGWLGV